MLVHCVPLPKPRGFERRTCEPCVRESNGHAAHRVSRCPGQICCLKVNGKTDYLLHIPPTERSLARLCPPPSERVDRGSAGKTETNNGVGLARGALFVNVRLAGISLVIQYQSQSFQHARRSIGHNTQGHHGTFGSRQCWDISK